MRRTLVAALSDTHGNHPLGLFNPTTEFEPPLPMMGVPPVPVPEPTPANFKMFEWYSSDIAALKDIAGGDPIFMIHMGDPSQGLLLGKGQTLTSIPSFQRQIAEWNFMPWLEIPNVKWMRFLAGTEIHEERWASVTMGLAYDLSRRRPDLDIAVSYHDILDVDGVILNLAHHGPPPGRRVWLRGNELRLYIRTLMMDALMTGKMPPDIVARAHRHQYVPEVVCMRVEHQTYRTSGFIVPSYCLIDDYGRKTVQSPEWTDIGMLVWEIQDGRHVWTHEIVRSVDFRSHEVVYIESKKVEEENGRGSDLPAGTGISTEGEIGIP